MNKNSKQLLKKLYFSYYKDATATSITKRIVTNCKK